MKQGTVRTWRFGVAGFSLTAAVAVYCFARIHPPKILLPLQDLNAGLASSPAIFGSAPSFFYTLALGLIIGAFASSHAKARLHCLAWTGLASLLELSQHQSTAPSLSTWLEAILAEPLWSIFMPYWTRGTFDFLDLLATLVGGTIALVLLAALPRKQKYASRW